MPCEILWKNPFFLTHAHAHTQMFLLFPGILQKNWSRGTSISNDTVWAYLLFNLWFMDELFLVSMAMCNYHQSLASTLQKRSIYLQWQRVLNKLHVITPESLIGLDHWLFNVTLCHELHALNIKDEAHKIRRKRVDTFTGWLEMLLRGNKSVNLNCVCVCAWCVCVCEYTPPTRHPSKAHHWVQPAPAAPLWEI